MQNFLHKSNSWNAAAPLVHFNIQMLPIPADPLTDPDCAIVWGKESSKNWLENSRSARGLSVQHPKPLLGLHQMEVWPTITEAWASPFKRGSGKLVSAVEFLGYLKCTSKNVLFVSFNVALDEAILPQFDKNVFPAVSVCTSWSNILVHLCEQSEGVAGGCCSTDCVSGTRSRAPSCLSQDVGYPVWQHRRRAPRLQRQEEVVRRWSEVGRTGGGGRQGQRISPAAVNGLTWIQNISTWTRWEHMLTS